MLGDAMSRDGGFTCFQAATPLIKEAIKKKLPFMKRYLLYPGPPIHSSETTLIRRAKDLAADVDYRRAFRKFCPPATEEPQGGRRRGRRGENGRPTS